MAAAVWIWHPDVEGVVIYRTYTGVLNKWRNKKVAAKLTEHPAKILCPGSKNTFF
jgi:hypothetical protein